MRAIKAHFMRNAAFYLGARLSILMTISLTIYLAWEFHTA
jgi:hypothetical protein